MLFHHVTNMAMPKHNNPFPQIHDTYDFGRPLLGHHYHTCNIPSLSNLISPGAEKTKNYINFTLFAPKLSHLQGGGNGWVINFTISCLLTLHMLHIPKFGKDWPGNSKEEHVNVQQMSHNNGREPIAIGHQSDSADLKTQQVKPKQIHRKK